jgi:vanillate/4-hydroxybenzoate decarboxylase subunit D
MHAFPRPDQPYLSVERTPVQGRCPECGGGNLAEYPVLSEGGWWNVRKCQDCLASLQRERGPLFGVYVPLGLEILRGVEA